MVSLGTLIDWFFYGFIRYVMFWIPFVTPFSVDRSVPGNWWAYSGYSDWLHKDDNDGGPDEHWLQCWFRMVFGEALDTAVESVRPVVRKLEDRVLGWIGGVPGRFPSLAHWIDNLEKLLGRYVPSWAGTVARGLEWLRDRLPVGIRQGWQSWRGLFDNILTDARSWVRGYVDAFREFADLAWGWVRGAGQALDDWRYRVGGWIDSFRNDPRGYVTGLLGGAWDWLAGFRDRGRDQVLEWLGPDIHTLLNFGRECARFYFNLWSLGWRELGEFVGDPRAYLMDRLERALSDRW